MNIFKKHSISRIPKHASVGVLEQSFTMRSLMVLVLALALSLFAPRAFAAGQTCVWTGGGSDTNFSTALNWSGCGGGAPTTGDALSLPSSGVNIAGNSPVVLVNDLTSVTFTSITQSGANISNSWTSDNLYKITGNPIAVTGGISSTAVKQNGTRLDLELATDVNILGNQTFSYVDTGNYLDGSSLSVSPVIAVGTYTLTIENTFLDSRFSGSGEIRGQVNNTLMNYQGDSTSFTGTLTAVSGQTSLSERRILESVGRLSVEDGATLTLAASLIGDGTFTAPMTLAGTGTAGYGALWISGGGGVPYYHTFSGDVTVTKNATIRATNATATFTGNKVGGYSITPAADSANTVTIPAAWRESTAGTTTDTISDLQPSLNLSVTTGETVILNGSRGDVNVSDGGVLKGTGTIAGNATIDGVIAPGLSPGCLTVNGNFALTGNYQFELGGNVACTGYDQIIVGGTVTLDSGASTLTASRYNNFTPTQGQVFIIVDNKGSSAVSGTFKDLAEGATFEQNGVVYKISYVGGDGNDVTLTVQNVPTAPNTGFSMLLANPVVTLLLTVMSGLGIVAISRKLRSQKA